MKELIYTKFSNERSREFAIRTDIFEENGKRSVRKVALFPEGKQHVARLAGIQKALNEEYREAGFECNRCTLSGDELWLEYVTAETLEERIDLLLEEKEPEKAKELLLTFLRKIKAIHETDDFIMTEEFRRFFGDVSLPEGLKCAKYTNIDLICPNLMLTSPRTVLDYEWTFDFPVPGKYVLYRNLHYLGEFGIGRMDLNMAELCEKLGIDEDLIETFRIMEENFQQAVVGEHVPLRSIYQDVSPGAAELVIERPEALEIYFNMGDGYDQENSVQTLVRGGKISFSVPVPPGCRDVRIDPCSSPCMVSIFRIAADGHELPVQEMQILGGYLRGKRAYFATDDPAFARVAIPQGASRLDIRMNYVKVDKKTAERLIQLEMENDRQTRMDDKRVLDLMMENEGLKAQMKEFKKSSAWKMYEMVRKKDS